MVRLGHAIQHRHSGIASKREADALGCVEEVVIENLIVQCECSGGCTVDLRAQSTKVYDVLNPGTTPLQQLVAHDVPSKVVCVGGIRRLVRAFLAGGAAAASMVWRC